MIDREPSLSDIEVSARQESISKLVGAVAALPTVEVFAEQENHTRFPNQLLIDGFGFSVHQKIEITE